MNYHKFHSNGLVIFSLIWLIVILSSCTSQQEQMRQFQKEATKKAWQQEHKLVEIGHSGTREWTQDERKELLKYGKVYGYHGRYIDENIKDNQRLATSPNNIAFAMKGEPITEKALQIASLRSYILTYEKKKYFIWCVMTVVIVILIVSFKKKNIVITTPAIVSGFIGTIWLGIVSGGSILAMLAGFVAGLVIGTITGALTLLVLISIGVG